MFWRAARALFVWRSYGNGPPDAEPELCRLRSSARFETGKPAPSQVFARPAARSGATEADPSAAIPLHIYRDHRAPCWGKAHSPGVASPIELTALAVKAERARTAMIESWLRLLP